MGRQPAARKQACAKRGGSTAVRPPNRGGVERDRGGPKRSTRGIDRASGERNPELPQCGLYLTSRRPAQRGGGGAASAHHTGATGDASPSGPPVRCIQVPSHTTAGPAVARKAIRQHPVDAPLAHRFGGHRRRIFPIPLPQCGLQGLVAEFGVEIARHHGRNRKHGLDKSCKLGPRCAHAKMHPTARTPPTDLPTPTIPIELTMAP